MAALGGRMGESMLEVFTSTKPRETAGATTSNAYDFQKSWALCELIQLHLDDADYLMVFDFHEDVVVFDGEDAPTHSDFYQIKSKSTDGNWTINALTKRDQKKPNALSKLEKLYSSHEKFGDRASALFFVSNQGFSVKPANGRRNIAVSHVRFLELSTIDKSKICDALYPEPAPSCDLSGLYKLALLRCDLSPGNHRTHTKGRLVEFFDARHPGCQVDIALAYRTLTDEIARRTAFHEPCNSLDELKENKALGKSGFGAIISVLVTRRSRQQVWTEIDNALAHEGCTLLQRRSIRSAWEEYVVNEMNSADESAAQFKHLVLRRLQSHLDGEFDGNTLDLVEIVYSDPAITSTLYSKEYTAAVVLTEIIGDVSFQEANTKPEDQKQ